MTSSSNPQVQLWRGEFGDAYVDRNTASPDTLRANVSMWSKILSHTMVAPPQSILEVGANIGINLRALRSLTAARFYAIEPNDKARSILVRDKVLDEKDLRGGTASAIDFPDGVAEFSYTSGVLVHIHPDNLLPSCKEIYRCSTRWIGCIEYFADKPETVPYRGNNDQLFKRDFGSLWLDNFPDLRTVAYGFAWRRLTGLDNVNWWLFEKR